MSGYVIDEMEFFGEEKMINRRDEGIEKRKRKRKRSESHIYKKKRERERERGEAVTV